MLGEFPVHEKRMPRGCWHASVCREGQPKSKESQIFTKVEVEVDGKEFSSDID